MHAGSGELIEPKPVRITHEFNAISALCYAVDDLLSTCWRTLKYLNDTEDTDKAAGRVPLPKIHEQSFKVH